MAVKEVEAGLGGCKGLILETYLVDKRYIYLYL